MIFVSVNHHTDGDSAELRAMTILVVCCASHGADDGFSLSLSAMTIETSSRCWSLSNLDSWFALSRHELCTALLQSLRRTPTLSYHNRECVMLWYAVEVLKRYQHHMLLNILCIYVVGCASWWGVWKVNCCTTMMCTCTVDFEPVITKGAELCDDKDNILTIITIEKYLSAFVSTRTVKSANTNTKDILF